MLETRAVQSRRMNHATVWINNLADGVRSSNDLEP